MINEPEQSKTRPKRRRRGRGKDSRSDGEDPLLKEPKKAIDSESLDFALEQFRHVEGMIHDHLRHLDDKARGSFAIASIITAALTVGIRTEFELIRIRDSFLYWVLLVFFFGGLLITFFAGLRAMHLRPAPITPNPYTTWAKFVTEPVGRFKYAITYEMARNHKGITREVLAKERWVHWTNIGLLVQASALSGLLIFSLFNVETTMSDDPNQTEQTVNDATPTGSPDATPDTSESSSSSENQYLGAGDGVDMSIPLKKSQGDDIETRERPIRWRDSDEKK